MVNVLRTHFALFHTAAFNTNERSTSVSIAVTPTRAFETEDTLGFPLDCLWNAFGLPLDSLDSHISHASSDKTLLAHDWRRFCWQIGALG